MKNALFIMKYPLEEQYSIIQKLNGQMNAVKGLDYNVHYISFDRNYLYLNTNTEKVILRKTRFNNSKLYYHLFSFYDIYEAAYTAINSNEYDFIYLRYGPLNTSGLKMCKLACLKSKLIVEIPTFPADREKQKTALRRLYMKHSEKMWEKSARYISLFTLIGEEANSYLGVPAININNGVDVKDIEFRGNTRKLSERRHILAVASMCAWHGYDRLIKGFANWNSAEKSKYILDFVGGDGDGSLTKWKAMAKELGVIENVVFHGPKTGRELTELFSDATIGVCSLGMYRNGFFSGSVLKLREYMARGLPFVYAHDDPDINESMPWCLKISNDNSPVDMDLVNQFINDIESKCNLPEEMREYAINNMTWDAQFKKILLEIQ